MILTDYFSYVVTGLLTTERDVGVLKDELRLLAPEFLVISPVGGVVCRAARIAGSGDFLSVFDWALDQRRQGSLSVVWTLDDNPRYLSISGPVSSTSFCLEQTRVRTQVMKAARFGGWVQTQKCRAEAWLRIRDRLQLLVPGAGVESDQEAIAFFRTRDGELFFRSHGDLMVSCVEEASIDSGRPIVLSDSDEKLFSARDPLLLNKAESSIIRLTLAKSNEAFSGPDPHRSIQDLKHRSIDSLQIVEGVAMANYPRFADSFRMARLLIDGNVDLVRGTVADAAGNNSFEQFANYWLRVVPYIRLFSIFGWKESQLRGVLAVIFVDGVMGGMGSWNDTVLGPDDADKDMEFRRTFRDFKAALLGKIHRSEC
jgi:hypothetical protein